MDALIVGVIILFCFVVLPIGYGIWYFSFRQPYDFFPLTKGVIPGDKVAYRRHKETKKWEQKVRKVTVLFSEDGSCIQVRVGRRSWQPIPEDAIPKIQEPTGDTE